MKELKVLQRNIPDEEFWKELEGALNDGWEIKGVAETHQSPLRIIIVKDSLRDKK